MIRLLTVFLTLFVFVNPPFAAADKLQPRLSKEDMGGTFTTPLESLLKEEESAAKEERHLDPKWIDAIRGDEQVRLALRLAENERHAVQNAKNEIRELTQERTRAKKSLAEADQEINDAKLKELQEDKQYNTLELAKFYSVRGMTDNEKAAEIGFIQTRLDELSAQLERKKSKGEDSALELEFLGLKGWFESLLARPETDEIYELTPQMVNLLLFLQVTGAELFPKSDEPVAEIELGEQAAQNEPESVSEARKRVAETSVELFGHKDQLSGSKQFAQKILEEEIDWAALENRKKALISLKVALIKMDKTPETQSPELRAVVREITLIGRLAKSHASLQKLTTDPEKISQVELRENLEKDYNRLSSQLENKTVELDSHQRLLNLRNYQSVSSAMELVSRLILNYTGGSKQALVSPLSEQTNKSSLVSLDIAFVTLMNTLETFEAQAAYSSHVGDLYPSQSLVSTALNLAKAFKDYILSSSPNPEDNLVRPSKADLVKQFHLAKNGMATIKEAYRFVLSKGMGLFETTTITDLQEFLKGLSINKVIEITGKFTDFMMAHPVLAKELSANLMHTYALCTLGGKSYEGIAAELVNSGRISLQRRTAEDVVADLLLGSSEHLYSAEGATKLPPEVLVLVDFAEKAPYLVGAWLGVHTKTTGSQFSQSLVSYIPFIGSHPVVQVIAGATAGIAEVKVQKELAARISRDQEIFANSIILAFNAYGGGDIMNAVKQASAYALGRAALQGLGDFLRAVHDEKDILSYAKRKAEEIAESFKAQPGKKAAQVGVGGLVGTGTGFVVGAFAITASAAAALPIAIIIGGGIIGAVATPSLFTTVCELINPDAKVERLKCEKLQRLKSIRDKIPTLVEKGVYAGKNDKRVEEETVKAIIEANNKISDEDLKLMAESERDPEELLIDEVQNNLNSLNTERQQMITNGIIAQDPELVAVKKDLNRLREQNGSNTRRQIIDGIKKRIEASSKGEAKDKFELQITKLLNELEQDLTLSQTAFQKKVDEIALDVNLLRVRQFEDVLESNAQFQKNEVGLHIPSPEEIEATAHH